MKPTLWLLIPLGFLLAVPSNLRAQPVPHHFEGIAVAPDQKVTLTLGGSVSNIYNVTGAVSNQVRQLFDLYLVETSTNLRQWTPLVSLLRTNNDPNPLIAQDTPGADPTGRFYRTATNFLLTAFPKPSGPFAVGTVDRVMIDPTRTNRYRYTPGTNAFMVTFWYPADPPAAGVLPAAMWDRRLAADTSLYSGNGFNAEWAKVTPSMVGHRFRDLPLAAGAGRLPVVVSSHGLGATRQLGSRTAEELASHGYVVVALDHTDCWASEFPDGRYLTSLHSGDVPGRLLDLKFLIDQLAVLDSSDSHFAGRLDLDRLGVSGASYGGMVVETCRTDSRVKCAALYDATNVQLSRAGLQKPLLIALGESNFFYSEDHWLFGKATTNAVFLQIRVADHYTLSDVGWTAQLPWGRGPALAMDACYLWFFDTYLKGEAPPFPTNPEIYGVIRK